MSLVSLLKFHKLRTPDRYSSLQLEIKLMHWCQSYNIKDFLPFYCASRLGVRDWIIFPFYSVFGWNIFSVVFEHSSVWKIKRFQPWSSYLCLCELVWSDSEDFTSTALAFVCFIISEIHEHYQYLSWLLHSKQTRQGISKWAGARGKVVQENSEKLGEQRIKNHAEHRYVRRGGWNITTFWIAEGLWKTKGNKRGKGWSHALSPLPPAPLSTVVCILSGMPVMHANDLWP